MQVGSRNRTLREGHLLLQSQHWQVQRISLCLLINLHAVPIGFRDVEALRAIQRDRHRPPEIRLGLG